MSHYEHTCNALWVVMVIIRVMVRVRVQLNPAYNYDYTALWVRYNTLKVCS